MVYVAPFMFVLYPGFVGQGDAGEIAQAALSGLVLVIAIPCLLSRQPLTGRRGLDATFYLIAIGLAALPHWAGSLAGLLLLGFGLWRRRTTLKDGASNVASALSERRSV